MRPISGHDCISVAAIIRSAFATLAVDPAPSALVVSPAMIAQHLAEGGGGAMIDPERACLLWLGKHSGLYVSRLSVHPAARNQGLASALLGAAEAEALCRGLPWLHLSTRLAAHGNRSLFARFGFVERQRHAHPGYDQPTYVDMEKPLGNHA